MNMPDFDPLAHNLGSLLSNADDLCLDLLTASGSHPHASTAKPTLSKPVDLLAHLEAAPVLLKKERSCFENQEHCQEQMDRFIPSRMKENLQARFEAVSANTGEYLKT